MTQNDQQPPTPEWPNLIEPPAWHADVLAARNAAVERGDEEFEDWQQAREEINKASR